MEGVVVGREGVVVGREGEDGREGVSGAWESHEEEKREWMQYQMNHE